MAELIEPLIVTLRRDIPMLVRTAPATGEALEGVLARQDLSRCCDLLKGTLGSPVKEFGQPVSLEPKLRKAVEKLGGIRVEQCLFLKAVDDQHGAYATLWPWASDPARVTLKVGVCQLVP